jgi:hypothetical protein
MLAEPQLAGTACCYWSFHSQMKPHDAFISFLCSGLNPNIYVKSTLQHWDSKWVCDLMMRWLQDSMRNILMWVTIYDPFASNLGIDENWNRLDYPWIIIVPLPFFLYVESLLSHSKFSPSSHILTAYIFWFSRLGRQKLSSAHNIA